MRLILAHVLLEFDIMLEPESEEWNKQEVYSTWLKKPLKVQLRPAAKTYAYLSFLIFPDGDFTIIIINLFEKI